MSYIKHLSILTMMNLEIFKRRLTTASKFDWMFDTSSITNNGNKISIQGKSIEDSIYLFKKLNKYLQSNNIPFKIATAKRFEMNNVNKEQSHKAMTIYCINGFDFKKLCEDVYNLTLEYKGWYDIKTPSSYIHYAGGLYIRNDRNVNGCYIPAN